MIDIYTDGGCDVNSSKAGAWAFVVVKDDANIFEQWGSKIDTTNSEMEIMALMAALKFALQSGDKVIIHSDSSYCVKSYNEWAFNWSKKDWRKSNNKPIEHRVLWEEIHNLRSPKIKVQWIKAHAGNYWNEYVDKLCLNR